MPLRIGRVVGEETPDEGAVSVPKKLTIGHFRQDVEEIQGRSILDEAIAGSEENRGQVPGLWCLELYFLGRDSGGTRPARR